MFAQGRLLAPFGHFDSNLRIFISDEQCHFWKSLRIGSCPHLGTLLSVSKFTFLTKLRNYDFLMLSILKIMMHACVMHFICYYYYCPISKVVATTCMKFNISFWSLSYMSKFSNMHPRRTNAQTLLRLLLSLCNYHCYCYCYCLQARARRVLRASLLWISEA